MEESYSGKFVLFLFRFPDEIEPMSVELCWMQLLYVRASWGYNFFFFFFLFSIPPVFPSTHCHHCCFIYVQG